MTDMILNAAIFLLTLVLVAGFFRRDGRWAPERGRKAFRFFTCLSNVLCAAAALLTAAKGSTSSRRSGLNDAMEIRFMAAVSVGLTMQS